MRNVSAIVSLLALLAAGEANAGDCPGSPGALGTSRVIVVEPTEHARLGTMQYRETLPLEDHEVVLTFDDGPLPPYSTRILDTLAAECVKVTYFLVGGMARAYPDIVRRMAAEGHTLGTHSQNHPFTFHYMSLANAEREIEQGIASVAAALGGAQAPAPFFRIPGLLRADQVERYLASRALMTWSADFPADDWKHIKASEVLRRAITRLEAKGRGVLLLHDIQPATALALPGLLQELKARGYRIVHVQPAAPDRPKTATLPSQWVLGGVKEMWPRPTLSIGLLLSEPSLPAATPESFGVSHPFAPEASITLPPERPRAVTGQVPLPPEPIWPRSVNEPLVPENAAVAKASLPAPDPERFGVVNGLLRVPAIASRLVHEAPTPRGRSSLLSRLGASRSASAARRTPGRAPMATSQPDLDHQLTFRPL